MRREEPIGRAGEARDRIVSDAGTIRGKRVGRLVTPEEMKAERRRRKGCGSRVVFVHGAFDLLHPGHVRLLEQARSLGDVLMVGVHSDATNASSSQSSRTITPFAERAEIVAALAAVDFVTELEPGKIAEIAGLLLPDVMVKGAASGQQTPSNEEIRAAEIIKRAGGAVTVIPLEPGYSRASLMERIRQAGA